MAHRAVPFLRAVGLAVVLGLLLVSPPASGQAGPMPSTKSGDWPMYAADLSGSRYSPLDQINGTNFSKLEVAWRFKTDSLGPRPEYKLEGTPLVIKGVLYATAGTRRDVVALDAKTGELLWVHSYREGRRAAIAPRQLSGRGLAYWTDGKGDDRVLYVTTGYRLIALNARTGAMIDSFGRNGVVDLKEGAVFGNRQPIDLETGEIGIHSAPTVVKDVVIVGSSMKEGLTVVTHNNTKGLVRAFDVRSGKTVWTFNTIPRPGEIGNETWEDDSWAVNGNAGVWTQITVDEEAGLVYLPIETPTSDYYGGHRPGNNLFAESLVAVELATGRRRWHYQLVHHPIWNFDNSCAPALLDIVVDGRPIKAVALPSKQAWVYVLDRITGRPVWPIEERPVPQSDVPGEKTSPTQPFPTKPPPFARNVLNVPDDLIDYTPEMRAQALELLKRYRWSPPSPFMPPILGNVTGLLGSLGASANGGTNWAGAGHDPETHVLYAQALNLAVGSRSIVVPPAGYSDIRYVAGVGGRPFVELAAPGTGAAADAPVRPPVPPPAPPPGTPPAAGAPAAGEGGGGLTVQGLPLVKPPYGVLSAVNLDRGELMWQVPHGETPDNVRNHPALRGLTVPRTGQPATSVGVLVTKTLVVAGDNLVTSPPGRPRGAMLRAYDKTSGREVGELWMAAPQSGSPMTYAVEGKQYIVVAISGGNYSGEYLAFSLPASDTQTR